SQRVSTTSRVARAARIARLPHARPASAESAAVPARAAAGMRRSAGTPSIILDHRPDPVGDRVGPPHAAPRPSRLPDQDVDPVRPCGTVAGVAWVADDRDPEVAGPLWALDALHVRERHLVAVNLQPNQIMSIPPELAPDHPDVRVDV